MNQKAMQGSQPQSATAPADLTVTTMTDVGRSRQYQQDSVSYLIPTDPQQLAHKGAIYLVADGMGGHQAGDVASQGAVKHVAAEYYANTSPDIGASLVHAFRSASRMIYQQAQANPALKGMGTTLVAAVIVGRKVYIASVGDSRAYLITPQSIRQITEDHSLVNEQVRAGLLTPEEARVHPQRNVVTRALGTRANVEPDLFEGELGDADMLFMCTDGVTGHLKDREIASLTHAHPPAEALQQIVDLANERGGHDNMGMLIVAGPQAAPAAAPAAPAAVPPAVTEVRDNVPAAAPWGRRTLLLAGSGVAALVLILLGFLSWRFIWVPRHATQTPVATSAAAPPQTGTVSASDVPTATLTAEQALSGTVAPGDMPPGSTVTATSSSAAIDPTSTLAPTATATRPRRLPTLPPILPTRTHSPTPTPTPYQAPALAAPAGGAELHGRVPFQWTWSGVLSADEYFDVRFWSQSELDAGTGGRGGADLTKETQLEIDLDNLHTIVEHGGATTYYWAVVVVRQSDGTIVSGYSEQRPFHYRLPVEGDGQGAGSGPPSPPRTPPVATVKPPAPG